ncbi:MAG: right-handed parallel beta-helix repeat-containing protein [Prevotellaceae bacterium]|jgi:hypothetical protein|nr:right-handed parallel beta-helix repeat-containing protein [Prevotellaceae bacterium]
MRQTFLKIGALLGVIALMFSCSREDTVATGLNEGLVDFTVSTAIPQSIKTYASHNGGATNVDEGTYDLRYILEVWTKETTPRLAYRGYKIVPDNFRDSKVTFSARLLAMQYDFVFWADFVDEGTTEAAAATADKYYKTNGGESADDIKSDPALYPGLTAIEIKGAYGISNDARDAFYQKVENVDLTATTQIGNVTLTRPFGKYRLIATDTPDGYLSVTDNIKSAKITYTAAAGSSSPISLPSKFNALTGEADGTIRTNVATAFLNAAITIEDATVKDTTYEQALILGFDYIFATDPNVAQQTVAFNVDLYSDATGSSRIGATREISNIPIVENKLTTIIGNFFTKNFTYTVSIDDEFDSETVAVGVGPNKTIIIDKTSGTVTIPTSYVGVAESVTFILTDDADDITIADENTGAPYSGTVFIGNPEAKRNYDNLTIALPEATVTVYDDVTTLEVSTASNTLVIAKDAVIDALTVNKGNVDIYGTVNTLTVVGSDITVTADLGNATTIAGQADTKYFWRVATADELHTVLTSNATTNHGVVLTADIKNAQRSTSGVRAFAIGGNNDAAAYKGYTFDGNGHILSGYSTLTAPSATSNVLVSHSEEVTIKNLIIEKPTNLPSTTKLNGLTIYEVPGTGLTTLDNVTVRNFKQAGVVIMGSNVTATELHTSGNGWGGVNIDGAGATFDFSDGTSSFDEATKVWADHTDLNSYTVNLPTDWTAVSLGTTTIYYPDADPTPIPTTPGALATAITSVPAGGTLALAAGTYDIGTGITISKDITLVGTADTKISAVLPATQSSTPNTQGKNPALYITGGEVTLKNITVTTDQTPAGQEVDGITITAGTLTLDNVTFDGIVNAGGQSGAQFGRAVTTYGSSVLTVTNSTFKRYNKNGIHAIGSSTVNVSNSTFIGVSPVNDSQAQNGVVFVDSSTGSVTNSSFTDILNGYAVLNMSTGSVTDNGNNSYNNCGGEWYP